MSRIASMKKPFIILISFFTTLSSVAQKEFTYKIQGIISGLNNDSAILLIRNYDKNGTLKSDSVFTVAKNNQFYFTGKIDAVYDASIRLGGINSRKGFSLFIERGSIKVNGKIDSLDYVSVSGTPGNDEYTANKKAEDKIYSRIRRLQSQLKQQAENKEEATAITSQVNAFRDSIKESRIRFISTHKNSPASAIYLYVLQDHITVEQLEQFYTNLSPKVKNLGYVKNIPEKINARKSTAIGNTAPEFAATDINGKQFKISEFRGSYVLLEFWASWCVPCREENPDLKKAYNTFHNKGFVVIGISLDDKKDRWEKAIKDDELPWIHTSELNAFDNKLAKLYGVQPIPDNFLINPQGKIIARQLSAKEVADWLSKEINQH